MSRLPVQERTLHILMRFSDRMMPTGQTITAHQEVISKRGAVWLAKAGKRLGLETIRTINEQTSSGLPSFLYLVQRGEEGYELYKGNLLHLSRSLPENADKLVPSYYRRSLFLSKVGLWMKLSKLEVASPGELERLFVARTGTPAIVALHSSMAGLFVIRRVPARVGSRLRD